MITHPEFGRNVMVGTLFTDAHPGNGVVQDVFDDLGMELDNRNVNKVLLLIKYVHKSRSNKYTQPRI